jgi:hypothetical protein
LGIAGALSAVQREINRKVRKVREGFHWFSFAILASFAVNTEKCKHNDEDVHEKFKKNVPFVSSVVKQFLLHFAPYRETADNAQN